VCLKLVLAHEIVLLLAEMNISVQFHDQAQFGAVEVNYIGTNWMLPAPLAFTKFPPSEAPPELLFRGSL